ncbi:S8 family serine peptidase [Conexibacter stalactiti]|uniref:S8 family serine peptidase n=1 Tax=Conexibacter stalactiti TaxID=1940611 RepID=A0ABU4HIC4_9ACTN|nr:S8 family serine peptidase [Conexibacter stalactiti]MDW5593022.1 S8 family serine peptidase [Conexibacter stalactiti]MEC5033663.1 S8 family serine peptidase [Conexibacter stalactiti]
MKVLNGQKPFRVGTLALILSFGRRSTRYRLTATCRVREGRQLVDGARLRRRGCGFRRWWNALLVVAAYALLAQPSAAETVVTSQARSTVAEFLVTAAPPSTIGAVCMVDTGVELTPDTASVAARISVWDDLVGDMSPTRHGTLVAALITAAPNSWGTVGIWPPARVVSVRANVNGADEFTVPSYYHGLQRCDELASYYGITVVLMALGSAASLTEEQAAAMADRVASARRRGLNVVAAAGNNGGGALETPAQLPGVLSVGGAAADGSRCALSAVGARLQAPGCGVDATDPITGAGVAFEGTTAAAAITAGALSALRSWRPDLGPDAAEQLLLAGARASPAGAYLHVAGAFRAAGLGAVVDTAPKLGPVPPPTPPSPPDDGRPDLAPPAERLARPRVVVRRTARRPRRLVVRFSNLPHGAAATVVFSVRSRGSRPDRMRRVGILRTRRRASYAVVRSLQAIRATVHYTDLARRRPTSATTIVRVGPARRARR